jgi:hypothetical protein
MPPAGMACSAFPSASCTSFLEKKIMRESPELKKWTEGTPSGAERV